MEHVRIRACTHQDIDAVLQLDRQWEQEHIAHDFIPISREEFEAALQSDSLVFHCNTCDTNWTPSGEEIAALRKQFSKNSN